MDDKNAPATPETTLRDEYLSKLQEGLQSQIQKNPELASTPGFNISTYVPGMQFVAACNTYLGDAQRDQFKSAMARYMGLEAPKQSSSGEDIDVFDDVRSECQALLSGRPDLQKQWDEVYGGRETWEKMHSALEEAKKMENASPEV